jgi:hypothetical protein
MSMFGNKYEALHEFLLREKRDDFTLTFEEIEEIIGFNLPRAAQRAEWWDEAQPEHPREQSDAIRGAGFDSRRTPDGKAVRFRKPHTIKKW